MSVSLFDFDLNGTHYRFNSGNDNVDALGETFKPVAIRRRDIELRGANTGNTSTAVRVEMNADDPFIRQLFATALLPGVTIYNWDGATATPVFEGKVNRPIETRGTGNGRVAGIEVLSLYDTALIGLYQNIGYQHRCNWTLYDAGTCGVIKANYSRNTTITALAQGNRAITLASTAAPSGQTGRTGVDYTNYYHGGTIQLGTIAAPVGVARKIIRQQGNVVYVENPILKVVGNSVSQVAVNDAVFISAGCNRTIETCHAKFGNDPEFGGYPTIPNRSPALSDLGRPDEVC